MELSRTIASMAVVLGVVVAGGFAAGEEQKAAEDQQKRRQDVERACNDPLKTDNDRARCRAAYQALNS